MAALGLTALALAGCYESPDDVTLHEPGVYKGPSDPLRNKLDDGELQQSLEQRFSGQTDR
ncbi:hypothetical protein DEM34_13020 [Spiribacter halobius]|uniref:Uncharacterized protein n=1 Tax=Sediminicurvatus halobius TaxID=2182432 RepID=A0A2U2MZ95_9GAMM|nr:hypothetical protein DEM34_13020 [Spiribacter halobius]